MTNIVDGGVGSEYASPRARPCRARETLRPPHYLTIRPAIRSSSGRNVDFTEQLSCCIHRLTRELNDQSIHAATVLFGR